MLPVGYGRSFSVSRVRSRGSRDQTDPMVCHWGCAQGRPGRSADGIALLAHQEISQAPDEIYRSPKRPAARNRGCIQCVQLGEYPVGHRLIDQRPHPVHRLQVRWVASMPPSRAMSASAACIAAAVTVGSGHHQLQPVARCTTPKTERRPFAHLQRRSSRCSSSAQTTIGAAECSRRTAATASSRPLLRRPPAPRHRP